MSKNIILSFLCMVLLAQSNNGQLSYSDVEMLKALIHKGIVVFDNNEIKLSESLKNQNLIQYLNTVNVDNCGGGGIGGL